VESFDGRLHYECLNAHLSHRWRRRDGSSEAWRTDYITVRPHSSLGGSAPAKFTNRPREGDTDTETKLSAA
jgi:putative transposase